MLLVSFPLGDKMSNELKQLLYMACGVTIALGIYVYRKLMSPGHLAWHRELAVIALPSAGVGATVLYMGGTPIQAGLAFLTSLGIASGINSAPQPKQ